MAYQSPVSATQVGSFFVAQYYQILRKQPNVAHQFYTDSSTMIRVDGDSSETASDLLQIHNLVTRLNFTGIEIKTINSLESWNGGVLVVVSGCIRAEYFNGKRNYVETFLLAPQDKGFYVLNDIFHFIEEDVQQYAVPALSENRVDSQLPTSIPPQEMQGYTHSHYDYETEASQYVDTVHINNVDQVDDYREGQQEQLQQQSYVPETCTVLDDTPAKEASPVLENYVEPVQEYQQECQQEYQQECQQEYQQEYQPSVEEPVTERPKLTYASILRASKGPSAPAVSRPTIAKSAAPPSEWQQPQAYPQQPIVPEQQSSEAANEKSSVEEVEILKSVYVRNLPSDITASEIEHEFKTFGKIIADGVFIRNKKEIGVCYAFVEYEDLQAVHDAVQASPIQLDGRPIYIEERRANSTGGAPRGGRTGRGRGRGSYQTDSYNSYRGQYGSRSSSRGGYQTSGDYNRYQTNGFRG